jgi:hypothetical protein
MVRTKVKAKRYISRCRLTEDNWIRVGDAARRASRNEMRRPGGRLNPILVYDDYVIIDDVIIITDEEIIECYICYRDKYLSEMIKCPQCIYLLCNQCRPRVLHCPICRKNF